MRYSTHVIPFRVEFRSGVSIYEQVVYAAKKAMVSGRLGPGAPFPSVRALSRELKINPNTAHKVIARLLADGLLESKPGVGTLVTERIRGSASERTELLGRELEQLVVEAKNLGIGVEDVTNAVSAHWKRLRHADEPQANTGMGGRKKG
jgi:GntR family transcriptional regulator